MGRQASLSLGGRDIFEGFEKEYAGEELPEKAQKAFADHDALPMAKQGDSFRYAYNCQAVVDGESQIVVAADLHEAPNDYQVLPEMLKQTVDNCGENVEAELADAGYRSASNIAMIKSCGSESYIALAKGERFADDDVRACLKVVINEDDSVSVHCPAGK